MRKLSLRFVLLISVPLTLLTVVITRPVLGQMEFGEFIPDRAHYGIAHYPMKDENGKVVPPSKIWDDLKLDSKTPKYRKAVQDFFRANGVILEKGNAYDVPYDQHINDLYARILSENPSLLAQIVDGASDPKPAIALHYLKLAIPKIAVDLQLPAFTKLDLITKSEATLYRYGDPVGEAYFRKVLDTGVALIQAHKALSVDGTDPDSELAIIQAADLFALNKRTDLTDELMTLASNQIGDYDLISIMLRWRSDKVVDDLKRIWPTIGYGTKHTPYAVVAFASLGDEDVKPVARQEYLSPQTNADRAVFGAALMKLDGANGTAGVEDEIDQTLAKEPSSENMQPFGDTQELLAAIGKLNLTQLSPQLVEIVSAYAGSSGDPGSFQSERGPNGYMNAVTAAESLDEMHVLLSKPAVVALIAKLASSDVTANYVLPVAVSYVAEYGSPSDLNGALPPFDVQQLAAEAKLRPVPEALIARPLLTEADGTELKVAMP